MDLTDVPGAKAPDLFYLGRAQTGNPSAATLVNSFFYDSKTETLTYQNINGQTLASVLSLLQNLTVQVYVNGVPQWQDPQHTIPKTTTVQVMNAKTSAALLAKYNADNIANDLPAGVGPPDGTYGFIMGGGGKFSFIAKNMDLGTTAGIQSRGVGLYQVNGSYPLANLANLFARGSDISVNLSGNLGMYSTSIASLSGGNISVDVGGEVDAGSAVFNVSSKVARGIYTSGGGSVQISAAGDINVNGSRIATYDGGDITIKSANGNVDAGNGGSSTVIVYEYSVDRKTRAVTSTSFGIPFSGIVALTFPDSSSTLGNVLVETPNGNITSGSGGIIQLSLNQSNPEVVNSVIRGLYRNSINFFRFKYPNKPLISFNELTAQLFLDLFGEFNQANPSTSVTLLAGYELQDGMPVKISEDRNIDVSGTGVISQNAALKASGSVKGLIFAKGNIDVAAQQNVNVTALAQGTATIGAGGTVSGQIIGVGGIAASGSSIDASLLSSGTISGATTGQSGFAQGTAANATSAAASSDNASQTAENSSTSGADEDDQKKKKSVALAQKVGRVTVLLPTKKKTKERKMIMMLQPMMAANAAVCSPSKMRQPRDRSR